jgi:hypothetical protein
MLKRDVSHRTKLILLVVVLIVLTNLITGFIVYNWQQSKNPCSSGYTGPECCRGLC